MDIPWKQQNRIKNKKKKERTASFFYSRLEEMVRKWYAYEKINFWTA